MSPEILHMQAMAKSIPATTEHIASLGATAGLDEKACFQLRVVLAEVLNNILNYALPAQSREQIEIRCRVAEGSFEVTTLDKGKPIEVQPKHNFPDARTEGGRGWPIILSWMDSIEYRSEPGCNELTLKKSLF